MTYGIVGVGAIATAIDHATPGGTNEQFLGVLQQERMFDAVDDGLNRVLDRLTRSSRNL